MTYEVNWSEVWEKLKGDTTTLLVNLIIVVTIFVIAHLILKKLSSHTAKTIEKAKQLEDIEKGKEITTAMTILRSVSRYLIYFVAIILSLNQIGFGNSVNNVLVTAGIGSLVISLGAQSIIQDMLAGLFIIFEKQYSVGDFVKIGDYTGTVTSIAMRLTYLTNTEGQKVIIPNGQVKSVINYGNTYNLAKIVIPTNYQTDTRKVIASLEEMIDKYYQENKKLFVEKPVVVGITQFTINSVDIKITAKVKPLKQWQVEKDLSLLAKEKLESESISIR